MKKSFIHNEDECLHSFPCLLIGLPIQHSCCHKNFGFYLHVDKENDILSSQVPTIGFKLRL